MTVGADPTFALIHALRLKGRASPAVLATATGLDQAGVEATLTTLAENGWAVFRETRPAGWALTPAGADGHRQAIEDRRRGDAPGVEAIDRAYRRFLRLNGPFKALCTDWQMREGKHVNDHTDSGYDRQVIERLSSLHQEATEIVDDLTRVAPRFGPYRDRLNSAAGRLRSGDVTAFTTPLTDSYHDVWMELHEDFLVTLGIPRQEGAT